MTINEAFAIFKGELELPDRKQKEAADAQSEMRGGIASELYVPRSFLTGSYSRHTKIDPLNDIDVLLQRNDRRVKLSQEGSGIGPKDAIDQVAKAIQKAYPKAAVLEQSRSVNVEFPGLSFGFDLVPGWLRDPDGYWIPDCDNRRWIPTDPEAHSDLLTQANKKSGQMLKPVIKMAKHWSRKNYDLLRSFHIELICVDIFQNTGILNYQVGVATFLAHLERYVGKLMMDPIYGVSRVDKELPDMEKEKLRSRVTSDANTAVEALRLEVAGNDTAAIEKWRRVFISGFPS